MLDRSLAVQHNWSNRGYRNISSLTLSSHPAWLQEFFHATLRAAVFRRLKLYSGVSRFKHFADVGCGRGEWTIDALSFCDFATGFDVNPNFLKEGMLLRSALPHSDQERVKFVQADLVSLDVSEAVDCVVFGASLMYVDDRELHIVLEKWAQKLPPHGSMYVRASVVPERVKEYSTGSGYYRKQDSYISALQKCGMVIHETCWSAQLAVHELIESKTNSVTSERISHFAGSINHRLRTMRSQNDYFNIFATRS